MLSRTEGCTFGIFSKRQNAEVPGETSVSVGGSHLVVQENPQKLAAGAREAVPRVPPNETVEDLKESLDLMRKIKKINPNILLQNCIFLPLPATVMFKEAIKLGYNPPTPLKGWSERGIGSRFEERNDITWMSKSALKEYTKIYNDEFGEYKHAWQREKDGEYVNPMHD